MNQSSSITIGNREQLNLQHFSLLIFIDRYPGISLKVNKVTKERDKPKQIELLPFIRIATSVSGKARQN